MLVGVPREIKNHEYRAGLVPASVRELVACGHGVLVQSGLGDGIDMPDAAYKDAGAEVAADAMEVFARADMIVKVKEPQPDECRMLRKGQVLFTYLHLAADPAQAELLLQSGATAIAYETVTSDAGQLPLLAPMSEVAGRMAVQAGAHALEKAQGGRGVLLGGVTGVLPGQVLIIGGGVVGENAATIAAGMGADVTLLDKSLPRLRQLDARFGGLVRCLYATEDLVQQCSSESDMVIGAVLLPGAAAPKLLRRAAIRAMRAASVLVDVAIDQGGCFETSRATTHQDPIYVEEDVIHYCVANIPGAVPRTSTFALNHATLPFILQLANKGVQCALDEDTHLRNGLNIEAGRVRHKAVAEALDQPYSPH